MRKKFDGVSLIVVVGLNPTRNGRITKLFPGANQSISLEIKIGGVLSFDLFNRLKIPDCPLFDVPITRTD